MQYELLLVTSSTQEDHTELLMKVRARLYHQIIIDLRCDSRNAEISCICHRFRV